MKIYWVAKNSLHWCYITQVRLSSQTADYQHNFTITISITIFTR